jgi:hypothetical protein
VQAQASALLLLGSSERHYTASKLYPALLTERPILAVYHEASTVVGVLRRTALPPTARLVTYGDVDRAASRIEAVYEALAALVRNPVFDPTAVNLDAIGEYSARSLARKLATILDRAAGGSSPR